MKLEKWVTICLTTFFVLGTSSVTLAKGPRDSGGGTRVQLATGEFALIDLVNFPVEGSKNKPTGGVRVPMTRSLTEWGVAAVSIKDTGLADELRAITAYHRNRSPFLGTLLQKAVDRLQLYVLDFEFGEAVDVDDVFRNSRSAGLTARRIAVYLKGYGAFVSRPGFESLPRPDQIAFLIHESYRHIELTFGLDMSDETLQKLTSATIQTFNNRTSLDSVGFLDGKILGYLAAEIDASNDPVFLRGICQKTAKFGFSSRVCETNVESEDMFTRSDLFAQLSSELLVFRIGIPRSSLSIRPEIEDIEISLDKKVALRRGMGINEIGIKASESVYDLLYPVKLATVARDIDANGLLRSQYRDFARDLIRFMKSQQIVR